MAKFAIGDRVKVVRLLDYITSRSLVGIVGTIREIEELPNGQFNYYVDKHYMHEEELERVANEKDRMRTGKIHHKVKIVDNLEEMPSYGGSLTCQCRCGAIWKLADCLRCPDCDGSHTYVVVEPIGGYALEG